MPKPDESIALQTIALHVPAEVCRQLRLAIMEARDRGESWKSLESRTMISDTNLIKLVKGKRYMGAMIAARLAQALGFELQMKVVARRKKAA
jgi:hypothetical protein